MTDKIDVLAKLASDMHELAASFKAINGEAFSSAIGLLATQSHTLTMVVDFMMVAMKTCGDKKPEGMDAMLLMLLMRLELLQKETLGFVFAVIPKEKHSELVKCLEVVMKSLSKAVVELKAQGV